MRRSLFVLGSALLCSTRLLTGQTVLAGFVREDSTERPISGVEVIIEGSARRATTDARGKFVLAGLPSGIPVALFRSVGWRPVRVQVALVEGDTVWTEANLVRESVRLAPIEVTAEVKVPHGVREGFEERRRMGFGKFLDSTLLRASEHLRVFDLLRRVQGITFARNGSKVIATSIRRPGCSMQVVLDGMILYRSYAPTSQDTTGRPPPDLVRDFDVSALESIEVYRGAAETPSEFNGSGAACGTVVLWSRRD